MLILKYFATVGTVLGTFLLALNAYLDPFGSNAAARVPSSMTTASVYLALPMTQTKSAINPEVSQPKVAAASAPKAGDQDFHRCCEKAA
jgi:hypothetical protein